MNFQSSLFQEISAEEIKNIFVHALGESIIWKAALLDGGAFNTTYLVEYGSLHKKAVLRLGPVNRHLLAGFENNLMEAEVYFYSICRDVGIPCSCVLACDTSKQMIDRDFMIVEYIPSIVMAKAEMPKDRRNEIYYQMGLQLAKLHQVQGESFGFLSRICEGIHFDNWSDALIFEVEDISKRLELSGGLSKEEAEILRKEFCESRNLLNEIQTPRLIHTDLWEGNVLLNKDTLEIEAIIDGDRAVFGDTDFEFASHWMNNPFLKEGYGSPVQEELSSNRRKRFRLYQMFYLLLEAYVGHCEYNDNGLYENRKKQLLELMSSTEWGKM